MLLVTSCAVLAAIAWADDACAICGRRGDHEGDELTDARRAAHEAAQECENGRR
jgi:hypothetical protein